METFDPDVNTMTRPYRQIFPLQEVQWANMTVFVPFDRYAERPRSPRVPSSFSLVLPLLIPSPYSLVSPPPPDRSSHGVASFEFARYGGTYMTPMVFRGDCLHNIVSMRFVPSMAVDAPVWAALAVACILAGLYGAVRWAAPPGSRVLALWQSSEDDGKPASANSYSSASVASGGGGAGAAYAPLDQIELSSVESASPGRTHVS